MRNKINHNSYSQISEIKFLNSKNPKILRGFYYHVNLRDEVNYRRKNRLSHMKFQTEKCLDWSGEFTFNDTDKEQDSFASF